MSLNVVKICFLNVLIITMVPFVFAFGITNVVTRVNVCTMVFSKNEMEFYKLYKKDIHKLWDKRSNWKITNFAYIF